MIGKSKLAAVLAAMSLAGCASAAPSIAPPTSVDVAARSAALTATGLPPAEYFAVGALLVGERCHAYFRALGDRAAQLDFASTEVGLASGAAAGIGAAAGMGAGGLAISAITAALVQGTLSAEKNLPVPYPVATAHLVRRALGEYMAAAHEPATLAEAAMMVDAGAWLCSVPGATWLAQQAVATAVPRAFVPTPVGFTQSRGKGTLTPPLVEIR